MIVGVGFGILACMIWGFVYIAPLILSAYDPGLIALGRYFVFGLFSLGVALFQIKEYRHYSREDWIRSIVLGIIGNAFYYYLLVEACQRAGAAVTGAFTAMIPITVGLIGNWRAKQQNLRYIGWKALCPSLLLILVGMICLNVTEFVYLVESGRQTTGNFWFGVAIAFFSLFIWTWYPISHGEWLLKHPQRSAQAWATAQGFTVLPVAALGLLYYLQKVENVVALLEPTPIVFIVVTLVLAIVTSYAGNLCWTYMSQRVPASLGGQMIIFETLFAIIYTYLWRGEWPSGLMCTGMAFLFVGILCALYAFREGDVK